MDLSLNPLGDGGVAALGASLHVNHRLRSLKLVMCGFGLPGLEALCAGLAANSCLEALDIQVAFPSSLRCHHPELSSIIRPIPPVRLELRR